MKGIFAVEYTVIINRAELSLYLIGDFSNVLSISNVKIRDAENNIIFNLVNNNKELGFYQYLIDSKGNTNEFKISCNVVREIEEGFILTFDITMKNREKIRKMYIYKNNSFITFEK